MDLNAEEIVARFPGLEPLVAMTDPPWRFATLTSGVLTGTRAHRTYAEGLWIIDERRTGAHRRPIPGRLGPVVAEANFSGPLPDAVAVLQQPPNRTACDERASAATSQGPGPPSTTLSTAQHWIEASMTTSTQGVMLTWFCLNLENGGVDLTPADKLLRRHGTISIDRLRRLPDIVSSSPTTPDVIFLQEVSGFDGNGHELTFFAERLLRRAGLGQYRAFVTRSPRSHHHQAVLVAVERVEPVRHFTKVGTGHGTENLYGSVAVTVDGDEDQILMLRSVHLNSGNGDDRLAEVKCVHNGTKNGAPYERHAIIAGDFNSITTRRSAQDGEPQRDFSRMAPADRYGKGVWPATGHDGHTDPDTGALDYLIDSGWVDQHINDHSTTPTIAPGTDRGGELIIDRCLTFGSISTVPDSVWVDTPRDRYSDHCAFGGQVVVQRQQANR